MLSWPFNGRFDINQCRAAILRGEKDISSFSTDDMEFLVWAGAAKDALPLLWAECEKWGFPKTDEMRKKESRQKESRQKEFSFFEYERENRLTSC